MKKKKVKKPKRGTYDKELTECWGADNLTLRQRMFVAAFVGPAGGNARRAMKMAGYQMKMKRSSSLLNKPFVQDAIAQQLSRKMMSEEWAKDLLADTARSSMSNFLDVEPNGNIKVNFEKAQRNGAINQIQELKYDRYGNPMIKLRDATKAREILLKFYKLIDDRDPGKSATQIPLEEYATDGSVAPPPGTEPTD